MQFSINLVLIIVTVLVSIGAFSNAKIMDDLIFYPAPFDPSNRKGSEYKRKE